MDINALRRDISLTNIFFLPGSGGNFLTIQLLDEDNHNQGNIVNEFMGGDPFDDPIQCHHPARFLYEIKPSVYKYWLNLFYIRKNILIHSGKYIQYICAIAEKKGQYRQEKIMLSEQHLLKKHNDKRQKGDRMYENPWSRFFIKQNKHMYYLSSQLKKYNKDCVFDLDYEKFFINAEHDSIHDLSKFLNKDLSFIKEKIIEYTKNNFNLLNPNNFI